MFLKKSRERNMEGSVKGSVPDPHQNLTGAFFACAPTRKIHEISLELCVIL